MYISKQDAMEILQITNDRTLRRYVSKYNIETQSNGNGRASLYKETDIHRVFSLTKESKDKYNPSTQKKAKEKKEQKQKEIEKKVKAKEKAESDKVNILNEVGQDEFMRVQDLLRENGTYKDVDRALLIAYAIAYQNYTFYVNMSSQLDHVSLDSNGAMKVSPYFQVADKFFKQMESMAKLLGVGERSRVGLEIKKQEEKSMFDILNAKDDF